MATRSSPRSSCARRPPRPHTHGNLRAGLDGPMPMPQLDLRAGRRLGPAVESGSGRRLRRSIGGSASLRVRGRELARTVGRSRAESCRRPLPLPRIVTPRPMRRPMSRPTDRRVSRRRPPVGPTARFAPPRPAARRDRREQRHGHLRAGLGQVRGGGRRRARVARRRGRPVDPVAAPARRRTSASSARGSSSRSSRSCRASSSRSSPRRCCSTVNRRSASAIRRPGSRS